jgi:predicted dehydrogenase
MYARAILKDHRDRAELVGFCDINQKRMDFYNRRHHEKLATPPTPTFKPDQFDEMIRQQRVDCVIVTSIDRTHHRYICRAMELGCDAITEKPMTIDAAKCQQILDCIQRTGRQLTVTFNYRYSPRNSKIRELIADGTIGRVISVHFEWLLDTKHGADYFRRWHRDKRNSGGLMVHKATHHFDLVNWWIDSVPEEVFGMGDLAFYGRENAELRGEQHFYERAHGRQHARHDPFALHLDQHDDLRQMYLEAEDEDGYLRDQSVFGDGISIEDDMSVMVRYRNQAVMTYHLTAYSPWEGYRVAFNGTRGRIEAEVYENSYVSGSENDTNRPDVRDSTELATKEPARIMLRPMWQPPMEIEVDEGIDEGGHGGGDVRLLADLFGPEHKDPLGRAASHIDGTYSIMTGIAANRSFATGRPVQVSDLVQFPE